MPIDQRSLISAAKRLARVAGAVYLLIAFSGGAARLGVRAGIPIPGYAPAADSTAVHVSVAAIAVATPFAFVGVTLYLPLRHVDRHAAAPRAVYVAVAAGMIVVNPLFHQAVMLTATGPLSATGGVRISGGLVALLLDTHDHGYTLAAVVFCLWLIAYLVTKGGIRVPANNVVPTALSA